MVKDFPENALSQHPQGKNHFFKGKKTTTNLFPFFSGLRTVILVYPQFFRNTSEFHLFYDLQCSSSHSIMLLHLECREPAIGDLIVPEP